MVISFFLILFIMPQYSLLSFLQAVGGNPSVPHVMDSGQPPAGMMELQEIPTVMPNVVLDAPRVVPRPIEQLPKMTD